MRMEGNPFLNYFWISAVELPAYIVGKYLGKFIDHLLLINDEIG